MSDLEATRQLGRDLAAELDALNADIRNAERVMRFHRLPEAAVRIGHRSALSWRRGRLWIDGPRKSVELVHAPRRVRVAAADLLPQLVRRNR